MAEKEIKGGCYTLVQFNGKLLASINSTVSYRRRVCLPRGRLPWEASSRRILLRTDAGNRLK